MSQPEVGLSTGRRVVVWDEEALDQYSVETRSAGGWRTVPAPGSISWYLNRNAKVYFNTRSSYIDHFRAMTNTTGNSSLPYRYRSNEDEMAHVGMQRWQAHVIAYRYWSDAADEMGNEIQAAAARADEVGRTGLSKLVALLAERTERE